MWNDTDTPLAYLVTFRCYGTWLHGDKRGSIDRHNNIYGSPKYPHLDHWEFINRARTKHPPVTLNAACRREVEAAVRETCRIRGWALYAVNVRTNHAHTVMSTGGRKPEIALTAIKANSTRRLRAAGLWIHGHSPWAEKGSKRSLWNEQSIEVAIDYVLNRQGNDLPNFDRL